MVRLPPARMRRVPPVRRSAREDRKAVLTAVPATRSNVLQILTQVPRAAEKAVFAALGFVFVFDTEHTVIARAA